MGEGRREVEKEREKEIKTNKNIRGAKEGSRQQLKTEYNDINYENESVKLKLITLYVH